MVLVWHERTTSDDDLPAIGVPRWHRKSQDQRQEYREDLSKLVFIADPLSS